VYSEGVRNGQCTPATSKMTRGRIPNEHARISLMYVFYIIVIIGISYNKIRTKIYPRRSFYFKVHSNAFGSDVALPHCQMDNGLSEEKEKGQDRTEDV